MTELSIALRASVKPVNKPTDKVILTVAGAQIHASAQDVVRRLIGPALNGHAVTVVNNAIEPAAVNDQPAIGAAVDGAIYAGLTLVDNQPAQLWLLPGDEEKNWKDAGEWAQQQGGELPSRFDALVLWTNLKKEFKEAWYWTSAQFAGNASYAWIQSFNYGYQFIYRKGLDCRVRAVRKVIIK